MLKGLGRTADAMYCIITSLNLYPWNWSCWTLLSKVVEDNDMVLTSPSIYCDPWNTDASIFFLIAGRHSEKTSRPSCDANIPRLVHD